MAVQPYHAYAEDSSQGPEGAGWGSRSAREGTSGQPAGLGALGVLGGIARWQRCRRGWGWRPGQGSDLRARCGELGTSTP